MTCNVCGYQWPAGSKFPAGDRPGCPQCLDAKPDLDAFLREHAEEWGTDLNHLPKEMRQAWVQQFWDEKGKE